MGDGSVFDLVLMALGVFMQAVAKGNTQIITYAIPDFLGQTKRPSKSKSFATDPFGGMNWTVHPGFGRSLQQHHLLSRRLLWDGHSKASVSQLLWAQWLLRQSQRHSADVLCTNDGEKIMAAASELKQQANMLRYVWICVEQAANG